MNARYTPSQLIHQARMSLPRHQPGPTVPTRTRRALVLACWIAVVYGTHSDLPHSEPLAAAAWACVAVFLSAFTAAVEGWSAVTPLTLCGLSTVALQWIAPGNGGFVAAVATIGLATRLDDKWGRWVAGLAAAGFVAASTFGTHPLSPSAVASTIPGLVFAYLATAAIRRLRLEQQRSESLLREALAGREAITRAAALDERARLAREMHDVLAHSLSALSIQLEGTRMLAEQCGSDPALVAAIERNAHLAKDGLVEARRAVGSLRDETPPSPALLPQLVQSFGQSTSVPCSLSVQGEAVHLSPEAGLTLYRVAQEALTNVRKHSNARCVEIKLSYTSDVVELVIENQGEPHASTLPGGGHGLRGMHERAAALGGRLEAGPTEKGFRVRAWIPLQPPSAC